MSGYFIRLMFRVLCAILIMFVASSAFAADLTVSVGAIKNDKGQIWIAVFDKDKGWPEGEPKFAAAVVAARAGAVTVTFHDVPTGRFAVSAFHDENGNGKFDKNFLGIPVESYGFSNGAKNFTAAQFDLGDGPLRQMIQLVD